MNAGKKKGAEWIFFEKSISILLQNRIALNLAISKPTGKTFNSIYSKSYKQLNKDFT